MNIERLSFIFYPLFFSIIFLILWALIPTAHAGSKVEICHFPPGNPANFHTITVNEKALGAHIENHGDSEGNCCSLELEEGISSQRSIRHS